LVLCHPPRRMVGCPVYTPPAAALSGDLTCAGGDTMQALTASWVRTFTHYNQRTHITVSRETRLSADGFAALLDGRVN
jgi:hypothetical protein